ncbi:MAG: hypothetical protein MZV49_07190 [Rhodopseudomonas palustris]|nr:hypothetical protein [Rhodopseudomonas palustris]
MTTSDISDVKSTVREKYAGAALKVTNGGGSCCGSSAIAGASPITSNLYDEAQAHGLPAEAMLASLGCGNPDGAGRSSSPARSSSTSAPAAASTCCCRPRRVGPTGKAYGLDMTDEMLALAQREPAQGRR